MGFHVIGKNEKKNISRKIKQHRRVEPEYRRGQHIDINWISQKQIEENARIQNEDDGFGGGGKIVHRFVAVRQQIKTGHTKKKEHAHLDHHHHFVRGDGLRIEEADECKFENGVNVVDVEVVLLFHAHAVIHQFHQ